MRDCVAISLELFFKSVRSDTILQEFIDDGMLDYKCELSPYIDAIVVSFKIDWS